MQNNSSSTLVDTSGSAVTGGCFQPVQAETVSAFLPEASRVLPEASLADLRSVWWLLVRLLWAWFRARAHACLELTQRLSKGFFLLFSVVLRRPGLTLLSVYLLFLFCATFHYAQLRTECNELTEFASRLTLRNRYPGESESMDRAPGMRDRACARATEFYDSVVFRAQAFLFSLPLLWWFFMRAPSTDAEVDLDAVEVRLSARVWLHEHADELYCGCFNSNPTRLSPSALHAVRCVRCESVLREVSEADWSAYFEKLDRVIAERKLPPGRVFPHLCPLDGYPPIHLIDSLCDEDAPFSREIGLPEGKVKGSNVSKQRNRVDYKKYKRGGKTTMHGEELKAFRLSHDDYHSFREYVEDGDFEQAKDHYYRAMLEEDDLENELEFLHNEGNPQEWASTKRDRHQRLLEHAEAETRLVASRMHDRGWGGFAGQRWTNAYQRRFGGAPEAALPEAPTSEEPCGVQSLSVLRQAHHELVSLYKGSVRALPEAGPQDPVLMEGTAWKSRITDIDGTMAQARSESRDLYAHHDRVVAENVEPKFPKVEPEATALPKVAKRRQRLRQRRNAKRDVSGVLPESQVPGSAPFPALQIAAFARFDNGHTMNGYLRNRGAGQDWFVTGRHGIATGFVKPRAVDQFPFRPVGQSFDLYQNGRPVQRVKIAEAHNEGSDRLSLRLEGFSGKIPRSHYAKQLAVGETVSIVYFNPKLESWIVQSGPVMAVSDSTVCYNISTSDGYCRAMVHTATGAIVGGHYHASLRLPDGRSFPGCERDTKDAVPGWAVKYDPIVTSELPQAASHLEYLGKLGPFKRQEELKVWGLRKDFKIQPCHKAKYFMAKPSTSMLVSEIQKFGEPSRCHIDSEKLKVAFGALLQLDAEAAVPYSHDLIMQSPDRFIEVAGHMDLSSTSSGAEGDLMTHHDFLCEIGGDGGSGMGARIVGEQAYDLYRYLSGVRLDRKWNEEMQDVAEICQIWAIQGKKDGYKEQKLRVGRSIQAPGFTLKLMWRVLFGDSGQVWGSRDHMFRTGANFDHPLEPDRVELYRRTRSSLGLDETAFDRFMPREFVHAFFVYMQAMNSYSVPSGVLDWFETCTVDSLLLLTTGDMYAKHRGNPSGFPDTLRLNSVVQLLSWCYLLQFHPKCADFNSADIANFFTEHVFLEICGDDSRANCLTLFAEEVMDAQHGFVGWLDMFGKLLPWEVKIEGQVVFTEEQLASPLCTRVHLFPPLVARTLTYIDGLFWQPLWNLDRCMRMFLSRGPNPALPVGRSVEEDREVALGTMMSLRNHFYWHIRGTHFSPLIASIIENGWLEPEFYKHMLATVADSYGRGALMCKRE